MVALSEYAGMMLAATHIARVLVLFTIAGTKLKAVRVGVMGATSVGMHAAQMAQPIGAKVIVCNPFIPHAKHPMLQAACVRWRGRLLLQLPS